jgi:hypothetical protein
MAQLSKQALKVGNNTSFPNNNTNYITPTILRDFNVDMIDSMVDEIPYGAYTQSVNTSLSNINAFTASASGLTTGSLLITASAAGNVITFTKGNNTTFNVTVATGSIPDISNLNQATASLQQYTASANIRFTNIESTTASLNTSVSNINTFTASTAISLTNLNQSSASQQISIDSLNSKTGSYATTGSNTFVGSNTFTSISASSFVSASAFIGNGGQLTGITASVAIPVASNGVPQGNATTLDFYGNAVGVQVIGGTALININAIGTGSFNAYTASTNTFTASAQVSINNLNLFTASFSTASLVSTSSFNSYTSSNNQRVSSLEVNSASVNTSISALNTYTASQYVSNSFFATTGSNTFNGDQIISGSLYVSGGINIQQLAGTNINANYPVLIYSGSTITKDNLDNFLYNPSSNSLIVSGATGLSQINTLTISFTSGSGNGVYTSVLGKNAIQNVIEGGNYIAISGNPSKVGAPSVTSFTNPALLALSSSGQPYVTLEFQPSSSAFTDGRITAKRLFVAEQGLQVTGSTQVQNFTASLSNGYAWIGNSLGQNTQVATASMSVATASIATAVSTSISTQNLQHFVTFVDNSTGTQAIYVDGGIKYNPNQDLLLVNNITSSGYISGSSLNLTGTLTASLASGYVWVGNGSNITSLVATSSFGGGSTIPVGTVSSSAQILNYGIFATTGSNTFRGNEAITGSLNVTGSTILRNLSTTETPLTIQSANTTDYYAVKVIEGGIFISSSDYGTSAVVGSDLLGIYTLNGGGFSTADATNNQYIAFSKGGVEVGWNNNSNTNFWLNDGSGLSNYTVVSPSGSGTFIAGTDTSDNQVGLIQFQSKANWTNGATTFITPLIAISGSIISGSFTLTGSAHGNVISASIASNTASIDFNLANYFELTASVSPLRINVTNITKGTTSTLAISGSTASTITFSTNVQQPSGSAYTASVSGQTDILSLVAFNSSKVNVVSTLKMI